MLYKWILLFLFLGNQPYEIFSKRIDHRSRSWTEDTENALISSKHVDLAERAIENFLTKLTGPVSGSIALRRTSNEKEGLGQTICDVSHVIRRNLIDFALTCGMTSTVRRYERNSNLYQKSNDWFSEILLQGSLLLHDFGGILEEVSSSVNRHFRKHNLTLLGNEVSNKDGNTRFLGTIDDLAEFCTRFCECSRSKIQRNPTLTIFGKTLANLGKESPKVTLKALESRLDVAFEDGSSKNSPIGHLHIFFCNFASGNTEYSQRACIEEFERLRECLSVSKNPTRTSKLEMDNRSNFLRNRWLSGLGDLSNCVADFDENGNPNVKCRTSRKMSKNPSHRVKYVYESLLGQKLSRRSPLHQVANDLGNVLSMTHWGRQLTEETYHYISVYQDGVKKMNRLSRLRKRDKKAAAKYQKVCRSLRLYKKGLILKTLDAIDKIHRTTIEFEKIVVSGIKTALNENWQSHVRILSCVSDWMAKLFLLFDHEDEEKNETTSTTVGPLSTESKESDMSDYEDDYSDNLDENALKPSRKALREAADKSFEKLMRSMNRVSVRTAYEKSTLTNLANNLLLTAMFMETIGFVSALFSLGNSNKEEINSSEINDDWSSRKRRSVIFQDPRNDSLTAEEEDFPFQVEMTRDVFLMYNDKGDYKNLSTRKKRLGKWPKDEKKIVKKK